MDDIYNELYDIFNCALHMLKKNDVPVNQSHITEELIKFLDRLRREKVGSRTEHHDFFRDFFSWLALRTYSISLDRSWIRETSSLIVDMFLQMLESYLPYDPLILIEILNIFVESMGQFIDLDCTYFKGNDDILFCAKYFNVSRKQSAYLEDLKIIGIKCHDDIQSTYDFFLSIIDRCSDMITTLDQTYVFQLLGLVSRMHENCGESLKRKVLLLIPRLMVGLEPTNCWERGVVYDSLFAYYEYQQLYPHDLAFFESLHSILSYIILDMPGFNKNLADLMFALTLEVTHTLAQSDDRCTISKWVHLSRNLLDHVDFNNVDTELVVSKIVNLYHKEFFPFIESYILKVLENNSVICSRNNGKIWTRDSNTSLLVEQISPVWKLCISILEKVSTVAYSSHYFEKLLDYASLIVYAGLRINFILRVKYPQENYELLNSRCLRTLSALPFMCNECLSDFNLSKYESLINYINVMLNFFACCEKSKLEDSYLIDHVFVVFTLPWNKQFTRNVPLNVKLSCLDGILNLIYVMSPEKSSKYVCIFSSDVYLEVAKSKENTLINKFLGILILLLFRAAPGIISELTSIVKTHLLPGKIEKFINNEYIGDKLLCFLSNRCIVKRQTDCWALLCSDCDALEGDIETSNFPLHHFNNYVALQFLDLLSKYQLPERDVTKYFLRFQNHSEYLKDSAAIRQFFNFFLSSPSSNHFFISEILSQIVYNRTNNEINKEVVNTIYLTLCSALADAKALSNEERGNVYSAVVEVTKLLLKIPYPCEMSIFKMLMMYYLPSGIQASGIRVLFKIALLSRGKNFDKFLRSHEPQIAKFVVDFILCTSFKDMSGNGVSSYIGIMSVLGFKTDCTLSGSTLTSQVLIEIIKMCEAEMSLYLISELATLFREDTKCFLEKHFENIFSEIYSLEDESVAARHLIPLFQSCGIGLDNSKYWKYSQLVCKLMLNSKHPLKIFRFLFQSKDQPMVTDNMENQIDAMKQHFIGCLTVIESTLNVVPSTVTLHVAKKYIQCISNFIKILGFKTVASIQVKLLTTLRTCLPHFYSTLPKHCLTAWVNFCFSVDTTKIGPYLSTIFIHVIPLFEKFPETVTNIFYYFVVQNGEQFKEQLSQLYFVPCYPNMKMQQVWCVIQSSLLIKGNFAREISTTLENIYCESTDTKIIALEHLRRNLRDHSSNLTKSLRSENGIIMFEHILMCLLDNANNKNVNVKTLCGACLGELGAIDPTKFGFNDVHKSYTPQKYNLKADDFSVLCITKIVHCLGKYDDNGITGTLYGTIQELLRLQLLDKNETDKFKYFSEFSIQDQYVLQPLLQTKYIFKSAKSETNSSSALVFGYHTNKTPCEWAFIWASQMLSRMPSSFQKSIFTTCLPAMRIDLEVTETILPYILLYALLYSELSDVDSIEQEMKYILHWDLSKHRTKPDEFMIIVGDSTKSVIHSDVSQTKYVAIVLDLLDFINQTVSDCYFFLASLGVPNEDQIEYKVKNFINRFPPCALSWKSFVQNDHCRSLYYIEKSSADVKIVENFKPLRNIYSKLNNVEGLVGVAKSSPCIPSSEEIMVNHMVYGAIQDALSGYERVCSKYDSTTTYKGLIQCYININHSSTALAVSSQIINCNKYFTPDIFNDHIEALWCSSRFSEIESVFEELEDSFLNGYCWNVDLVGILRLMSKFKHPEVLDKIKSIRLGIVSRVCDLNRSGMNLYRQAYWYILKLHILNDMESLSGILSTLAPNGTKHDHFKETWNYIDHRLTLLPTHGPYIQDVRKTHLQALDVIFNSTKVKAIKEDSNNVASLLGTMWLESAKKARKKQRLQDAYTCIGIAEKYQPPQLFLELAKYYQAKFETDAAVLVLQQGLNESSHFPSTGNNDETCRIIAKAKLLTASFNVSSMNLDFNDGYIAFKEAAEVYNLEKSFVCLASYLYKQHLTESDPDNTVAKRYIQLDSARNFSKSLLYGTKHIYQSMPCMLSLWLDYGARIAKKLGTSKKADESGMMKTLKDFNTLIENNLMCLPTYMFMTAFSQILSRINHRQPSCFEILKLIIIQIVQNYHQQAMWSFISVCRSNNSMQKKRTEEICKKIKAISKDLSKFFKVFSEFTEKLIDISVTTLKYNKQVNLSQLAPNFKTFISYCKHIPIMLPLQKFLTVHISSCKTVDTERQHTPYPLSPIYISDVKEQVMMLFSVQMPKRLEFVGSDGEIYPLMCKKDDLRLDSRIMEFNSVINLLLRMDSGAQEKNLSIRTYSVVPLNCECGVIEWLSGLLPLKGIVNDMYMKLNITPMPMSQIKKLMLVQKDKVDISERLRRFLDIILPKHPPVLHKWFFERHPSSDAWYYCKNAFVKSSAVMSMVGYVVGLGDRHGENILIDSKTGEAVHVDFNCLFNRSDSLTYPETVPFRLTHSMVRAMGATGVEGLFVISCEVTNRVMRRNSEQLLSVMKPFLYDIDVKTHNPRKQSEMETNSDDMSNDEAKVNIHNIEMRLNGVVRSKNDQYAPHRNSKPLSVEGQTKMLIKEATSNLNLCQMFAGWAPYI